MNASENASNFTDYVKEGIERCIQKYMSLEQTMAYLHENHQIHHPITRAIWEHLQRESPNFFKEYYKRCEVARQIAKYNDSLIRQRDMMQKLREIDPSPTIQVTQLQHQQDQLHDQCLDSYDFAYIENLISSESCFADPSLFVAAPPHSDPSSSTSGFEDANFEQFAREIEQEIATTHSESAATTKSNGSTTSICNISVARSAS